MTDFNVERHFLYRILLATLVAMVVIGTMYDIVVIQLRSQSADEAATPYIANGNVVNNTEEPKTLQFENDDNKDSNSLELELETKIDEVDLEAMSKNENDVKNVDSGHDHIARQSQSKTKGL